MSNEYLFEGIKQARGRYQRNLLSGNEAWSGSTLKGKALRYKIHYIHSQIHLLKRLEKQGIFGIYGPVKNQRNYTLFVYRTLEELERIKAWMK